MNNEGKPEERLKDPSKLEIADFIDSNEMRRCRDLARFHIAQMKEKEVFHVTPEHMQLGKSGFFYAANDYAQLVELEKQLTRSIVIERAPGFGMRDFLGHFCPKQFREEILEAQHADAVADYEECLAKGDMRRAKIVKYMTYVWLVKCVFGGVVMWALSKVSFRIGKSD